MRETMKQLPKFKITKKEKKEKKKVRIWTFSRRLLALCLLPMVIICVVIASVSTATLKNSIESQMEDSLQIIATAVSETYTNLYEGDYTVDFVGKVRKGDTVISGEYRLLDALKEGTGFDVSLLFGNSRLITSVAKENGARANGTPVDKAVYKEIEDGSRKFYDNLEIQGRECYVLYVPLINTDGSVIGSIEVSKESASIQQAINEQVASIVVISLVLCVIAVALVSILSRIMVKQMSRIKKFLESLIGGNLHNEPNTKDMKANDELGDIYRSIVKLQNTFMDIVKEIKYSCDDLINAAGKFTDMAKNTAEAADGVKVAVEEISNGARSQADGTASAHDNVSMISEQIGLIMQEVDDMAEYASDMSAKEKESEEIIGELSVSSDHTKGSVLKATEQMALMDSAVKDIKKAVEMIQDIADETDLLSLNASIEAARAGEAGRGFAVVAEQISKLALQSEESSRDIERILAEITAISAKMVNVMGEVRENMDAQQNKLDETRITYQAVSDGVEKSLENISNIKEKIDVLNASGESISGVVEDLASISEENAVTALNTMETSQHMNDTMQKIQDSSKELLQLADRLQEAVGSFVV